MRYAQSWAIDALAARHRRVFRLLSDFKTVVIVAGALAALFTWPARPAFAVTVPTSFVVESAVSGALDTPIGVAWLRDGRLFVCEKRGRVWLVTNGVAARRRWSRSRTRSWTTAIAGSSSVAVDPNYFVNHYHLPALHRRSRRQRLDDNDDALRPPHALHDELPATRTVADPASRTILMGATWTQGPLLGLAYAHHRHVALRLRRQPARSRSATARRSPTPTPAVSIPACSAPGRPTRRRTSARSARSTSASLAGKILRINPANGQGYPSNPLLGRQRDRRCRRACGPTACAIPYRFSVRPGGGSTNPAAGNPGTLYIGEVGWGTVGGVQRRRDQRGGNLRLALLRGPRRQRYTSAHPSHNGCNTIGTSTNPGVLTTPLMHLEPQQPVARMAACRRAWSATRRSAACSTPAPSYPTTYRNQYFFGDYGAELDQGRGGQR